jgi:hypothetical protein
MNLPFILQMEHEYTQDLSTVEPWFTNASHHEQIFRTKKVSGDKWCLE